MEGKNKGGILLVEDDRSLNRAVSLKLAKEGYDVYPAEDLKTGWQLYCDNDIALIICDIGLPDGSGLRLLEHIKRLRRRDNIIIISARDSIDDKVEGLELGADDYLPKPFHTAELMARIRSVLRRGRSGGELVLTAGNMTLDVDKVRVTVDGREVPLLKKEFDILLYFMQRPNHLVDKAVLAEAVWGDHADEADNFQFVYAQMKNLRRKMSEAGASAEIKSVYGFGYKLVPPER